MERETPSESSSLSASEAARLRFLATMGIADDVPDPAAGRTSGDPDEADDGLALSSGPDDMELPGATAHGGSVIRVEWERSSCSQKSQTPEESVKAEETPDRNREDSDSNALPSSDTPELSATETEGEAEILQLECPKCEGELVLRREHLGVEGSCVWCDAKIVAAESGAERRVKVFALFQPDPEPDQEKQSPPSVDDETSLVTEKRGESEDESLSQEKPSEGSFDETDSIPPQAGFSVLPDQANVPNAATASEAGFQAAQPDFEPIPEAMGESNFSPPENIWGVIAEDPPGETQSSPGKEAATEEVAAVDQWPNPSGWSAAPPRDTVDHVDTESRTLDADETSTTPVSEEKAAEDALPSGFEAFTSPSGGAFGAGFETHPLEDGDHSPALLKTPPQQETSTAPGESPAPVDFIPGGQETFPDSPPQQTEEPVSRTEDEAPKPLVEGFAFPAEASAAPVPSGTDSEASGFGDFLNAPIKPEKCTHPTSALPTTIENGFSIPSPSAEGVVGEQGMSFGNFGSLVPEKSNEPTNEGDGSASETPEEGPPAISSTWGVSAPLGEIHRDVPPARPAASPVPESNQVASPLFAPSGGHGSLPAMNLFSESQSLDDQFPVAEANTPGAQHSLQSEKAAPSPVADNESNASHSPVQFAPDAMPNVVSRPMGKRPARAPRKGLIVLMVILVGFVCGAALASFVLPVDAYIMKARGFMEEKFEPTPVPHATVEQSAPVIPPSADPAQPESSPPIASDPIPVP